MELTGFIIHAPKGIGRRSPEIPALTFYEKGTITINYQAAKLLGLSAENTILIIQNERHPENIYLRVCTFDKGFRLHPEKKSLRFYCESLSKKILSATSQSGAKKICLRVHPEPTAIMQTPVYSLVKIPSETNLHDS
jgi:hypothetical protein